MDEVARSDCCVSWPLDRFKVEKSKTLENGESISHSQHVRKMPVR